MGSVLRITGGLLLGGLVGAGVGLLLAPRSGQETRRMIRTFVEGVLAEGQQAADARRLELTSRFEALKQAKGGA